MRKFLLAMLLMLGMAHASIAQLLPMRPSPSELALLPDYCQASFLGPQHPQHNYWATHLGKKFGGFNHYCAGINYMNRYRSRITDNKRNYYLSRAVPEIDYTAQNMPADFPLAGEIFFNRGTAHELMRQDGVAIGDYYKAIEYDPKLAKAYGALANIHLKSGNKVKALGIVTTGLKKVPDSKMLQKKYISLGGKEPFPVADHPVSINKETEAAEAVKHEQFSDKRIGEVETVSNPTENTDRGNVALPTNENPSGENKAKGDENKPGIGSPTNPYCRFCP